MLAVLLCSMLACADFGPQPIEFVSDGAVTVVLTAPSNLQVNSGGGVRNTVASWTIGDATATVEVWIKPSGMTPEQATLLNADVDGFYRFVTAAAGASNVALFPLVPGGGGTYQIRIRHAKTGDTSPFTGVVTITN